MPRAKKIIEVPEEEVAPAAPEPEIENIPPPAAPAALPAPPAPAAPQGKDARDKVAVLQKKIKLYQKRFPHYFRDMDAGELAHALSRDATEEDATAVLDEMRMNSSGFDGNLGRMIYLSGTGAIEGVIAPMLGYDLTGLNAALAGNKPLMDKVDELTIEMTSGMSYVPPHVFVAVSTAQAILMVAAVNAAKKAAATEAPAPKPPKPAEGAAAVGAAVAKTGAAPEPLAATGGGMGGGCNEALPPGLRN